MEASPRKSSGHPSETSDEAIRVSYRQIIRTCFCAGLSPADAEDVAQDIWMWMIRVGVPLALIATPWLTAVVQNYILRYRRRNYSHQRREGRRLETVPEPESSNREAQLETNELLDRVASALPTLERRLLALIRRGYSLPEASRQLGIPPGSRAYYQGRLVACARRALRRPTATQKIPGAAYQCASQPFPSTAALGRPHRSSA
jgi:DNA-directed RNA polymerase specialized sigma24 family protein